VSQAYTAFSKSYLRHLPTSEREITDKTFSSGQSKHQPAGFLIHLGISSNFWLILKGSLNSSPFITLNKDRKHQDYRGSGVNCRLSSIV